MPENSRRRRRNGRRRRANDRARQDDNTIREEESVKTEERVETKEERVKTEEECVRTEEEFVKTEGERVEFEHDVKLEENGTGEERASKEIVSNAEISIQTTVNEEETQKLSTGDASCSKQPPSQKILEIYKVESPKPTQKKKKTGTITKSKSLDDDESIRIQELSGSESEDKTQECNAVISEADSDVDWEVTEDLQVKEKSPQTVRTMDIESLELEDCVTTKLKLISPEDESKLRCFLEGLNLVNSPEESEQQAQKQSAQSIRERRAKKREELAQYFLPVYQNPRFLDAISEESSDLSDREQKENKIKNENKDLRSEKAILIDRKRIETALISDTCKTSLEPVTISGVEVVYLEDDSDDYADAEDEGDEILSSQLTPPPTPDDISTKTDEVCKTDEEVPSAYEKISVLSPSVSPSFDREDSSSRGTSLCTTIFKDNQPLTLKELCLKALMGLPFGRDVLEELAAVSESLEELTTNVAKLPAFVPKDIFVKKETNHFEFLAGKRKKTDKEEKKNREMEGSEKWVGIASEQDPKVVVCLSPTQKEYLETTKKIPREADALLDLHNKFIERRSYKDDYLYYVDNDKSCTLPNFNQRSKESARLQARNLNEWLNLAKDKSKSETNLCEDLSFSLPGKGREMKRRQSLPQEFYVQQMQYLIQKEKEIQQELEKVEEEKRRLVNEMATEKEIEDRGSRFDPSKYHISKNEDIAIHNDELNKRFKVKAAPQTEVFRQQMYEEYKQQFAERQERKHHKMIKISSHQDLEKSDGNNKIKGIEDEFMNKVKERESKYGLKSEDSVERSDDDVNQINEVLVTDGKDVSEAKKLPKHLKEFVEIAKEAADSIHEDEAEDGGEFWKRRLELQWMLCELVNVLTRNVDF